MSLMPCVYYRDTFHYELKLSDVLQITRALVRDKRMWFTADRLDKMGGPLPHGVLLAVYL